MFVPIFARRFRPAPGPGCAGSAEGIRHRLARMLLLLLVLLPLRPAWADLMIAPTRVVFDKNQRAAQLDLINSGAETATYRISLVNRRMSETGEFTNVDSPAPGEQSAADLLRYSPRQVVLVPGVGQTIRLSLRKPADLPAGEYRSHLVFEKIAAPKAGTSIEIPGTSSEEISVQLTMLTGVSIPVIVRHGETAATVTLSDLELLKPAAGQAPVLAAVLHRSGNRSVYGDLGVTFTPRGGAAQEVGKAGGVAVYTPNPLRRVKLELKPPPGLVLAGGTLRLSYRDRPEAGGKLLAEATVELP